MNTNALSGRPSAAQRAWMQLGYGLFIHFGPNTLQGVGWGAGDFPAERFEIPDLDCDQWAELAAQAGMRYAVLTTKHHDGFCLWPSAHTDYSVRFAPSGRDIVAEYVRAFRARGLSVGLYYSLWDRNCPFYEDDVAYAAYMRAQITELLTNYGEIVELWFDGAWDKDHPTREWPYDPTWERDNAPGYHRGERWEWAALYEQIHALQPDCLVINNSSSDRPGGLRYWPLDVRTSEHFDFVHHERVCEPILNPVWQRPDGQTAYLPLEFCTSLNPAWFHTGGSFLHPSVETLCGWYRTARAAQANLLLNAGPNAQGHMPAYHGDYLRRAAQALGL